MIRKLIYFGLLVGIFAALPAQVQAQTGGWSVPVNLSQSGAAEQPRLVANSDGDVQVFWWDRFDGLTTAFSNGEAWTAGVAVPINLVEGQMPEFILDANGWVHAFWLLENDGIDLYHASMSLGETDWAVIETLAESVLDFKVQELADGAVAITYLRTEQDWSAPAGIFFQRLEPGTFVWNAPLSLDSSAYYRLETVETVWLHQAAEADNLTVIWHDPHIDEYKASISANGGWTWSMPAVLEPPDTGMGQPRALYWGGGRILIWQDEVSAGCVLLQQSPDESWQSGLTSLRDCPQADIAWGSGWQLFWLWGQGSRTLNLAAWDGLVWTQPLEIGFSVTDPADRTTKYLRDLHAEQANNRLFLIGSDGMGEVWFVQSEIGALELIEAPRQAWGLLGQLSISGMAGGEPALTVDTSGDFHAVWVEGLPGKVANTIFYTRMVGETVDQAVAVKSGGGGEFIRHPTLLADPTGWLHMAWSGGRRGEIYFSRVQVDEAGSSGAWLPNQIITTDAAAWPQLAQDISNRLYLLYVVQSNEGRGVYLSRSPDAGDTWNIPEKIFDAQEAGWAGVGSAAIAVSPSLDGGQTVSVHVAWVEEMLPGTLPSRGVWYSRAYASLADLSELEWSEPYLVAEEGAGFIRLVVSGGNIHLIYSLDEEGIWERSIPVNTSPRDMSGWGTANRALGWEGLQVQDVRTFGVGISGSSVGTDGTIHLVGMPDAGRLFYESWENNRWADPEEYVLAGWGLGAATWVDAVSLPSGGRLGVAWVSVDETGLPGVFWISRTIPVSEVLLDPTLVPTETSEVIMQVQPSTTPVPSPTPDLNQAPPVSASSDAPLVIGGGLAGLFVAGYLLVKRGRR